MSSCLPNRYLLTEPPFVALTVGPRASKSAQLLCVCVCGRVQGHYLTFPQMGPVCSRMRAHEWAWCCFELPAAS